MQELQPPEDGLFLVRESVRHPGDYVLCVSFGKEVIHYRVVHEENTLSIDSQQYFSNLIDMIEVRPPGRESHQCQRRARTSWAHTEQWQVLLSLSCSVRFSLVFVTWCNYLHQRLMVPTQFGVQWADLGYPKDVSANQLCHLQSQSPPKGHIPIPAYSVLHTAGRPWWSLPPLDFEAFYCVSLHSKPSLTC